MGPQAQEDDPADRVLAVTGLQDIGHAIPGDLCSQRGGQMRDVPDFPFVARGVGLHSGEITFVESRRLGTLAQKKLVGTIHIFDTRPGIVAFEKTQRRFQQIAVADIAASHILIPSPEQH